MNAHVHAIANRLSLRPPQRKSLEILAEVCDLISLEKAADAAPALAAIRSRFGSVADFERDFPSLCFALATGVGKTRLMGAFIAYLFKAESIRHFFVLAPNLTIYNKLIADFTPNTPKYVFQGIAEFAVNPPEIITGDNYESGRGIRAELGRQARFDFAAPDSIHVNIFNISKINAEVRADRAPRIKRLSEYIGESYFEYLSKLDDLVLLMDESHRYRATAGIRAINELKPILGLELTATPHVERGGETVPFRNVIYSYPLSEAMTDGFVKAPAVATRQNFNAANFDDAKLERLKLEDGVRIHQETKVHLEAYARDNGKPVVKPFMLVIAENTSHADELTKTVEDGAFFDGRYKGKVIQVHSKLSGEEKDEVVEQLINVERADNPTEIVIHVNMLKEGWDVTNLYTIVPLRAANSRTLVEQSIGRGLRLPYGKRTGVDAVDSLTIVAHDRFQEIVDYANRPDSIIRGGLKIVHITDEGSKLVVVEPEVLYRLAIPSPQDFRPDTSQGQELLFETAKQQEVAKATLEVIREYERLPRSADLAQPEIQKEIVEKVKAIIAPAQGELEAVARKVDVAGTVAKTIHERNELSIDIPRITVQPVGEVTRGYREFTLDPPAARHQPVPNDILIQELQRREQRLLTSGSGVIPEDRFENYLVRGLMEFDDVSYDDHGDLLFKLSGQMVRHLHSYLKTEDEVRNVLQYHQHTLVSLIHDQMQNHYEERATAYEASAPRGFTTLHPKNYTAPAGEVVRDFRAPVDDKQDIRRMLFGGFQKGLYRVVKFDSDSERRFAVILETDAEVMKWIKPSRQDIRIYHTGDASYEPDFVVEAMKAKFVCEVKASNDLSDDEVQAKAKAAAIWCEHATEHARAHRAKPWKYLLIPHDVIADNMTLEGLAGSYTFAG